MKVSGNNKWNLKFVDPKTLRAIKYANHCTEFHIFFVKIFKKVETSIGCTFLALKSSFMGREMNDRKKWDIWISNQYHSDICNFDFLRLEISFFSNLDNLVKANQVSQVHLPQRGINLEQIHQNRLKL